MDYSDILLTVDFDRTFSACDSSVPQRNIEAVQYFIEKGGTFTFNTGRSAVNFAKYMHLPVNAPLLLCNGAATFENGQLSQCVTIDIDTWEFIDTLHELFPNLDLEIHGAQCHYLVEPTEKVLKMYENVGWRWQYASRDVDMGPLFKVVFYGQPHEPAIANLYTATDEEIAEFSRLEEALERLYGDKLVLFRAAPRILNVHAKGISKLTAARTLQERLGKKILICAGDAQNDIPMLNGADYAFCPADSVIADRYPNVCRCDDGAIADIIYNEIPKILETL